MPEEVNGRTHLYNAHATILSGSLELPLVQAIKPQARVELPREGGYFSQRAENYRLEGVISFRTAYSQVAGNRSTKAGQGWTTLTTTAIEGLNILDVLTADRIVGQTITEHPLVGYVPSVNFLGTRFENLRIAGHPVSLDLDLNILGAKPAEDAPYSQDPGVVQRTSTQYKRILDDGALPALLRDRYNQLLSNVGSPEKQVFLGQSRDWRPCWPIRRSRDRHTGLWQNCTGQADSHFRGLQARYEDPEKDDDSTDDGRSRTGLCRRWRRISRLRFDERRNNAVAAADSAAPTLRASLLVRRRSSGSGI